MRNNQVTLTGCIASEFTYSHEILGEKFFTAYISVKRNSETTDTLPALFSERIIDTSKDYTGQPIIITGNFRSYNRQEENKSRLVLYVFVLDYQWTSSNENSNKAFLEGYICKKPIYRKTPLGREIADVMLAVNRQYGKSDYIPCICWGRNARFSESLELGAHVKVSGRIQSREYSKKIGEIESRKTAYELSVYTLEIAI